MPIPFAVQASLGCPTHAELVLALAAEFTDVDGGAADAALDALAAELFAARGLRDAEQVGAVGAVLRTFATAPAPLTDAGALMLDGVLHRLVGHPLLLAVIGCEAGRRAGIDLGIIGDGRRHLIAHRGSDEPVALDPALREGPDEEALRRFGWRCSHQVSFAILYELVACSLRTGDVGQAIRAAELRLALPLAPDALDQLRSELSRLRARLN